MHDKWQLPLSTRGCCIRKCHVISPLAHVQLPAELVLASRQVHTAAVAISLYVTHLWPALNTIPLQTGSFVGHWLWLLAASGDIVYCSSARGHDRLRGVYSRLQWVAVAQTKYTDVSRIFGAA